CPRPPLSSSVAASPENLPPALALSAEFSLCSSSASESKMPKVKTNRVKYPEGWELIEPTLRELQGKMREESRYIFDLYHRRNEISKELYEFCLDQGYGDRNLIAKWKKPGYERLCCLRCIQPRDHNYATTCVCRVPKNLREEEVIECVHCGCKGCASGD
ncbi:Protein BUD31 homolog 1, partial [Linum perenne]